LGLYLRHQHPQLGNLARLVLPIAIQLSPPPLLLRRTHHDQPALLIPVRLSGNAPPKAPIGLRDLVNIGIEPTDVLVDEHILLLMFEKGLGHLFQLLDPALLLYLVEALVDEAHVLLVLVDYLYLLLVMGYQVAEAEFDYRQGVGCLTLCDQGLLAVLLGAGAG